MIDRVRAGRRASARCGDTVYLAVVGVQRRGVSGAWPAGPVWTLVANSRSKARRRAADGPQPQPDVAARAASRDRSRTWPRARRWPTTPRSPPTRASRFAARSTRCETKLEKQTLEIVAFGTVSSGKSSVLNALAGRDVFRTDAQGRHDGHAQRNPLAGRRPGRCWSIRPAWPRSTAPARGAGQAGGPRRRSGAVRHRRAAARISSSRFSKRWPRWKSGSWSA